MRSRFRARSAGLVTVLAMLFSIAIPFGGAPVFGASVTSATFTGGAGTYVNGGTLYAKSGGTLTLTLVTSSDTRCVELSGAHSDKQTTGSGQANWTFSLTAGSGNGVQTVTATARPNVNVQGNCTGAPGSGSASYILDNAGPIVTASLAPSPNAAGWNKDDVTITWNATDAGAGVGSGPTPATDSVTADTAGVSTTATATDNLGNVGTGEVVVKRDATAPTIDGSRSPAANANGWSNTDVTVSFICADGLSGIKSCTGTTILTGNGAGQSVVGTAVDNADNSASTTVSNINIDKVPPTLSGAPTTAPNAAAWYRDDVTIAWTCADALSGIDGPCPADRTISGEGTGLTANASVSDLAGNSTSATSSPAIKIDRTPPLTIASAPTDWTNTDVTVTLTPSDALSGVAETYYELNGGPTQTGTSVSISDEGVHTLEFWSEDEAGNVEATNSVQVRIDVTAPTIGHVLTPPANTYGWHKASVTVSFSCEDTLSGIASCTEPQLVEDEGAGQVVTGTAVDQAGNSATDQASVSIDLTPPTISASVDRAPNANGWYDADVIVNFLCDDALSGILVCPGSQTVGEGAGQSASGTAEDVAGNTATAGVAGLNVDKTAPTLTGAPTTAPNGNGWYRDDVVVEWTCGDALSGIDGSCPADSTIDGEGDDLSASASVSDLAGNTTNASVTGIQIDRTPPTTLASVPEPLDSGWHAGPVEVTLDALDALSGVETTYYAVNDGTPQVYSGPFTHGVGGISTITFWSEDRAGNVEDADAPGHAITLRIDDVAPTIIGSRLPVANAFGWNNEPVLVSFTCSDEESGIAACSDPEELQDEGAGQSVTGLAMDIAGNTNSATVSDIDIDLTAPTLSGSATTDPNANGWYKGDVTIEWTGQDGLSGIDPATQPSDSVITGEGSNLGASATIADKAGNGGSGSVSGIKIDRTEPTISGAAVHDDGTPRSPNAAGWFDSAVRVRFTCDDALSGVDNCASDAVLMDDGANQSTSGEAVDKAGNTASTTVSGINIDSQAPTTTAVADCTLKNGWCTGNTATVTLSAQDQAGLSGVREIRYRIDAGAWQAAAGSSVDVTVPLAQDSGEATVAFYAVDNAGNAELQKGVSLLFDNVAPTVTGTLNPQPNAAGWNNSDITVTFTAVDDEGGSGVDEDTVTAAVTISNETAGTGVTGSAMDLAGNQGSTIVTVKLDKTPPTIAGATTTLPNANGWFDGPVSVHFECQDGLSGIAVCPADVVLSSDGEDQSVTGTAVDNAGNAASFTVSGINIDATAPSIDQITPANGSIHTLGDVPSPACEASDGGSGLAGPCSIQVTGGKANGVGTFSFVASATDDAGNTTTVTGSYQVIYRFDGYRQPINGTAHQAGTTPDFSVFKSGSTVPAKLQLKMADGTVVQANSLPEWIVPVKGSPMTAPVDETVYSTTATSGSTYRWDATDQQYIYNWGTPKNGNAFFWRIGIQLDDGRTYYVNIGLR